MLSLKKNRRGLSANNGNAPFMPSALLSINQIETRETALMPNGRTETMEKWKRPAEKCKQQSIEGDSFLLIPISAELESYVPSLVAPMLKNQHTNSLP